MTTSVESSSIVLSGDASNEMLKNRLIRNSLMKVERRSDSRSSRNHSHSWGQFKSKDAKFSVANEGISEDAPVGSVPPRKSMSMLWHGVSRVLTSERKWGVPERKQSTLEEIQMTEPDKDTEYTLTRPELMDDDLEIDYARWKKRLCCHQFSNQNLEKHFWTFYTDNHTNTIRITFMAFLAFPILGWISVDYLQKGKSGAMFWSILYLRMWWSLVIVLFLVFFWIGRKHVARLDSENSNEQDVTTCDGEDEGNFLADVRSDDELIPREVAVPVTVPWYKRVGVYTVYYTSHCVFVVAFVSCVISILISYMGNEPNHKPYIILFIVMHIFLGLGNNFCSFLCWITTVMFCIINFLLVESPYKTCAYVVGVSCVLTVMGEFLEFSYRKLFYKRRELELEQFKNDIMLTTVVPPRIALQLKRGEREAVSYIYEKPNWGASVLFCQICDFEQLSNDLSAAALVNYLNKVFTYMDRLSTKNKVYKVETVKEVYMAACGLPQPHADHMNQIAHFALDIKEFLIDVPERLAVDDKPDSKSATLKIGIHCGTVIAGVIGKLCPRYRLFGDTVNVAARMETNSEKGKIQISETFKKKIDHSVFETADRGLIKIKGKDSMHTYFLTGRNTKTDLGEGLMLTSANHEADSGISILKFCFDNSKLDADIDIRDSRCSLAQPGDKTVRLSDRKSMSGLKLTSNSSLKGSFTRGKTMKV